MRMLVVEDDTGLGPVLLAGLEGAEFRVDWVQDGLPATILAQQCAYDCIILDLGLPGCDGLDVCRNLRAGAVDTPILVISGRTAVDDRVQGLTVGADDYLVKPFELDELLARVRALLRRGRSKRFTRPLTCGPLLMDPGAHTASISGNDLKLTVLEFRLLWVLLENAGRVVTRGQLIRDVWGGLLQRRSNSPEVYVSYLREKLAAAPRPVIRTVRGIGYKLEDADGPSPG